MIKNNEKCRTNMRIARLYLLASLALAVAGAVYEYFSHGVYSNYMIYAFMVPLVLGCLLHLGKSAEIIEAGGLASEMLLMTSVATLSIWSVMKGVLGIYGTSNRLTAFYPVAAAILLTASVLIGFLNMRLKKAAGN